MSACSFVPILRKVFPEIVDFYSHRHGLDPQAVRRPRTSNHNGRMFYLRQFTYTKFVIVNDDDIDVHDWSQVIWALATRVYPARDSLLENTPIDYLDFASPEPGLGSKLGLDATCKWPGESRREWGRVIVPDPLVEQRMQALWNTLHPALHRQMSP